jgi:hypothetical protein
MRECARACERALVREGGEGNGRAREQVRPMVVSYIPPPPLYAVHSHGWLWAAVSLSVSVSVSVSLCLSVCLSLSLSPFLQLLYSFCGVRLYGFTSQPPHKAGDEAAESPVACVPCGEGPQTLWRSLGLLARLQNRPWSAACHLYSLPRSVGSSHTGCRAAYKSTWRAANTGRTSTPRPHSPTHPPTHPSTQPASHKPINRL